MGMKPSSRRLRPRGSTLTDVILGAMNDKVADEEAMIRKLALRKDVNAFREKL